MTVTEAELRGGLRALGLRSGDRVIVHSSLRSLGWVDGGAETVVDALCNVVGADGTVLMPTFTSGNDGHPFDRKTTPSETGRITEELRTREEAIRSAHPTHSVTALGASAELLTRDHELLNSLGPGSPMHRLLEDGGSILLLGVDHTSNSSVHIAERLADLPYRDQTRTVTVADGDESRTVTTNAVHCSYGFDAVEVIARRAGLLTDGLIGEAHVQLMSGHALLSELVDALEIVPNLLLCADPGCGRCEYARERLAEENLIELRDD
ncbi:AAC(3) family N-acetyltransferase [Natronolimnobius sp. AArcel1]|uniref:aminoglycoside N(3)-acetyltransferase n=1 Tax=Natronolimnobius sp. AArcel1 TaxID=1679093 RepID=UPI0013EB7C46|nr:AAC(3) family N-acetyltransferase [Natronolimnobius sp. AArcel1]NGM70635.1 AAC(3) family N-acetyltransferase [Natronolimnobius sp. AArcel1]